MIISKISRIPVIHRILIASTSAIMAIGIFMLPANLEKTANNDDKLIIGQIYPLDINPSLLITVDAKKKSNSYIRWESHKVKPNESAALLFSRIGLSARLLHDLTSSDEAINKQLSRLRPGDELRFGFNDQNELVQLIRPISRIETFQITKIGDEFKPNLETKKIKTLLNYSKATITSNFWNASISAGLNANQIMELAGIFGWDIDFALDLREGDHFEVLFEERYVEGQYAGTGNIIAASFTNQGTTFSAIREDDSGNYYDPSGRAMKKAFLRSPINFRYVSSNFNPRRLHPVTGLRRAHRGTDYVAPVGTPIWAAGDGIVDKAGYNQYNGNYVFIRHSNTYITKYLHMTKRYVKTGQRVKQGQTVGTLGRTGRVTGAHLHYEFLVNGVHKNPRTVKLPESKSLSGQKKAEFKPIALQRMKMLGRYGNLVLTNNSSLIQPK